MLRNLLKPMLLSTRVKMTHLPAVRFSTDADAARHIRYKRLVYQSQQRGWLELDLIIGSYVIQNEKRLMNNKSLDELTTLTSEENSDLIRWFIEGRPVPEKYHDNEVMQDMLKYAYSPDKPWFPKNGNQ